LLQWRKPVLRRQEQCVQFPAVRCRDNRFSNVRVRKCPEDLRAQPHGRASAAPCTRRDNRRLARVRLAWVRGFRLRGRFAQAAVRERLRAGRGSATFRVA